MNGSACSAPSEEYQYHFFPAVYVLALLVGLPGNMAALYVFAFRMALRTAFNVYISSLALADLLILGVLPFRVHYHLSGNDWAFGDAACSVTGILFYGNTYLSICFMTCICVDRYMATVHPHTYLRLRSRRCSLAASAALWTLGGVAVLVFILMGPLETEVDANGRRRCFENFAKKEWTKRLGAYSVLGLIFGSLLPSLVILVCYPLAARRIAAIRTRAARRAVRVIYTILAITVLCFLPNHVVYLLQVLRRKDVIHGCSYASVIHHARRVTTAMVVLNTCLDPLLYYVTTSHCDWRWLKMTWVWGALTRKRGVYVITVA